MKDRTEKCYIKLVLPINTPKKYRKIVGNIGQEFNMKKRDEFTLHYYLDIEYLNDTSKHLFDILKLVKAGYIIDADLKILNEKICLIQHILCEINNIKKGGEEK